MNIDKIVILRETIEEQKNMLLNSYNQNLVYIEEIDSYIQSLFEKEDSDYKVFSPRNVESVYAEQIAENNQKKNVYENENRKLDERISCLNSYIELIDEIQQEDKKGNSNASISVTDDEYQLNAIINTKSYSATNVEMNIKANDEIDKEMHTEIGTKTNIDPNAEIRIKTNTNSETNLNSNIEVSEVVCDAGNSEFNYDMLHRLKLIFSYIPLDYRRAKMELSSLIHKIEEH